MRLKCSVRATSLLLYESSREWLLRAVIAVCFIPTAIAAWLIPLAPREEWMQAPLGGIAWWLLPAMLILLTLVMPASLFLIHGRYVLRLSLQPDDSLEVTTFLLWGRRTKQCRPETFDADAFIIDRKGHAPHGFDAVTDPVSSEWLAGPVRRTRFTARRVES